MLKTKIIKILPLWGIGLGLTLVILTCSALLQQNQTLKTPVATAQQPQVLGASIDLRGQAPAVAVPVLGPGFDDAQVTAKSYLAADAATGNVIVEKNGGQKEYIASLTKLLTGLASYNSVDINATATLTPADEFNVSPVLYLRAGDSVKLLDLFNAMLVGSENDAALALSNHVAAITGQNFVDMMNSEAHSLGMSNSNFSNPLGFDSPQNYSTADDLLKLVLATQKLSVFTWLGRQTAYEFTGSLGKVYKAKATDTLIASHPEIQAVKTGYTQGAGQAMVTKATENGHGIYIIVLDSQDRETDTLTLENQIFNNTQFVVK